MALKNIFPLYLYGAAIKDLFKAKDLINGLLLSIKSISVQ